MLRRIVIVVAAACLTSAVAGAQETATPAGAGPVEIAAVPGGGMFFMKSTTGTEPDFSNYTMGTSVIGNINRWIGIEGDLSWALGMRQGLTFNQTALTDQKTPTMMSYTGGVLYSPWGSDRRIAPYGAAALGGMTMFNASSVENLGVTSNENYLVTNFGGGVKWFPIPHWGARADYRYYMIHNNADA